MCAWVDNAGDDVCRECGGDAAQEGPDRVCTSCYAEWYISYCWRCKAHIDERDTTRAADGWCICRCCGASAPPELIAEQEGEHGGGWA